MKDTHWYVMVRLRQPGEPIMYLLALLLIGWLSSSTLLDAAFLLLA
jgi:hypothetical protein